MTKQTWKNKDPEYLPEKPIWLVFDLCNGHAPVKRYVWWFDTKKDALAHIKFQRKNPTNAWLSEPQLWRPVTEIKNLGKLYPLPTDVKLAKKYNDVYG